MRTLALKLNNSGVGYRICSRAKCCYCRLWARQGGIQQQECPMSDRNVVATSVFIAGIMLGAFTVQLKDQLSLHLETSGLNTIMQCAATLGSMSAP